MVPIVSGVPASIILAIGGATLTETVFAFPGMGKMLIDSIKSANNSMIVGLTFIFTVLSIVSLLLGDIVMTLVDPRIKLSTKKGGK
ncbi:oligopeptide transport system permease [Streptococcus pyogenes]|nr:oligopeptide transport system permease [Streptococcus pyogenes]